MMRTCKTVLKGARKLLKNNVGYPNYYELSYQTNLHPGDVIEACKMLVETGFMEYTYQIVGGKTSKSPACVFLTLKGRKPIEYAASRFGEYLKENWIAILALFISLIALLQSLGIISLAQK